MTDFAGCGRSAGAGSSATAWRFTERKGLVAEGSGAAAVAVEEDVAALVGERVGGGHGGLL